MKEFKKGNQILRVRKLLPNPTLWFLSQQFFNAKVPAYKCLPGLIGFRRLTEFGLYRPRLFSEWPALALPTAYRQVYQQPGPVGTLGIAMGMFRCRMVDVGNATLNASLDKPAAGHLLLQIPAEFCALGEVIQPALDTWRALAVDLREKFTLVNCSLCR
ncbi:hypothetical protein HOY80DRAFT_1075138 [Tuber brumale]|nr:hypothetical protein HOY80DRAFT_1075138 [Tuber brumale]